MAGRGIDGYGRPSPEFLRKCKNASGLLERPLGDRSFSERLAPRRSGGVARPERPGGLSQWPLAGGSAGWPASFVTDHGAAPDATDELGQALSSFSGEPPSSTRRRPKLVGFVRGGHVLRSLSPGQNWPPQSIKERVGRPAGFANRRTETKANTQTA